MAVGGQVIFLQRYLYRDKTDAVDPQCWTLIGCFVLNFSRQRNKEGERESRGKLHTEETKDKLLFFFFFTNSRDYW